MCLIRKAVIVSYLHTSENLPEIQHPCCGETVASIPFNSNEESVHQQFATNNAHPFYFIYPNWS